jgi:predicted RNase H-like nuclease (RuvC/YqgF family)
MAKIFTQTAYHPAIENGIEIGNVRGSFREEETLDIWRSKQEGKKIFRSAIFINITVQTGKIIDMVSHEIIDKDERSETLKQKFAKAWAEFMTNPGKVIDGANEIAAHTQELEQAENEIDRLKADNSELLRRLDFMNAELQDLKKTKKSNKSE